MVERSLFAKDAFPFLLKVCNEVKVLFFKLQRSLSHPRMQTLKSDDYTDVAGSFRVEPLQIDLGLTCYERDPQIV